jgi:hypothetical protein
MELAVANDKVEVRREDRCLVCGQASAGPLCQECEHAGLNSRQFAKLFWDEA